MRKIIAISLLVSGSAFGTEDMINYYPFFKNRTGYVVNAKGKPFSEWTVKSIPENGYTVEWGHENIEHFSLKRINGVGFIFVNKFCDTLGHCWNIKTERSEIKMKNGLWETIPVQPVGKPLALRMIPETQYEIRVWGYIEKTNGTRGRDFFFAHRLNPPTYIKNSAWKYKEGNTRQAVFKEQAWWASTTGWTMGDGLIVNGKPDGSGIVFGHKASLAKNIGYMWTFNNGKATGGLYNYVDNSK